MAIKSSFLAEVALDPYFLTNLAFLWLDDGEKGGAAMGHSSGKGGKGGRNSSWCKSVQHLGMGSEDKDVQQCSSQDLHEFKRHCLKILFPGFFSFGLTY